MSATTWRPQPEPESVTLTFLPPTIRDPWSDDPDRMTRRGDVDPWQRASEPSGFPRRPSREQAQVARLASFARGRDPWDE